MILRLFSWRTWIWLSLCCTEQQPPPSPSPPPPVQRMALESKLLQIQVLPRLLSAVGQMKIHYSDTPALWSSGCCLSLCVVAENHLE